MEQTTSVHLKIIKWWGTETVFHYPLRHTVLHTGEKRERERCMWSSVWRGRLSVSPAKFCQMEDYSKKNKREHMTVNSVALSIWTHISESAHGQEILPQWRYILRSVLTLALIVCYKPEFDSFPCRCALYICYRCDSRAQKTFSHQTNKPSSDVKQAWVCTKTSGVTVSLLFPVLFVLRDGKQYPSPD